MSGPTVTRKVGIMTITEAKDVFVRFLFSRPVFTRTVEEARGLYVTRCPFCGDSSTTQRTGHLYILVQPDTDFKMVYYCQKCQAHGTVGRRLISKLDGDSSILNCVDSINKEAVNEIMSRGEEFTTFDVKVPENINPAYYKKIAYVERRLGIDIDDSMRWDMRLIASTYDFFILNNIKKANYKTYMMNLIERDYVGFLSAGGSHILFRDITESHEFPWLKYPIFRESLYNHVFYTYSSEIDIFTEDPITVNLSEGVMDTLGVKYHFNKDSKNDVNIAACGRNYYTIIKWLVSKGIYGKNVDVNFYLDNDKEYNNGKELPLQKDVIEVTKSLFGNVRKYKNLIGKDYGVPKEKIMLDRKMV